MPRVTWATWLAVLVSMTSSLTVLEGWPARFSCVALARTPPGRAVRVVPAIDSAMRTALATSSSPAPCWSAGVARSVAVLVRIRMTRSGDGLAPWCEER